MGVKRKLESTVDDIKPSLSAFAAAKSYIVGEVVVHEDNHGTLNGRDQPSLISGLKTTEDDSAQQAVAIRTPEVGTQDVLDLDYDSEAGMDNIDFEGNGATNGSEVEVLPMQEFSSWKPSQNNVSSTPGGQRIYMNYGQTLAVMGQFDLKAQSGVVSICGTFLNSQSSIQRIIAPLTEPMPVIRCVSSDGASIDLLDVPQSESYENLGRVSGMFKDIWTCKCPKCSETGTRSTFRKILDSKDLCSRHYIPSLQYPILWQRTISNLCDNRAKNIQMIAVAGALHSGKSTFSRFFANKILTPPKGADKPLIVFWDLDPNRPEVSLPGHIGLYFLEQPLLQTGFTRRLHKHPWDRSIYVGTALSGFNETFYLTAIQELFNQLHLESEKQYSGVTIIHCPGWYKGFGNTIFAKLLKICHLTDIICLSEIPVVVSEAIQNMDYTPTIHMLNSQGLIPSQSIRTHSELSEMSMLAYFHFQNRAGRKLDLTPISSWRPWVVSYHESSRDFKGVYFMDELPSMRPGVLTQLLNGCLVSAAIIADDHILPEIQLGEGDGIPYFPAAPHGYSDLPHPSKIRTIGLLLIRSIDAENRTLMCLNCSGSSEYPKERVILIAGGMEAPGWAYKEDVEYRQYAKHTADENASSYLVKSQKEYPWVGISAEESVE